MAGTGGNMEETSGMEKCYRIALIDSPPWVRWNQGLSPNQATNVDILLSYRSGNATVISACVAMYLQIQTQTVRKVYLNSCMYLFLDFLRGLWNVTPYTRSCPIGYSIYVCTVVLKYNENRSCNIFYTIRIATSVNIAPVVEDITCAVYCVTCNLNIGHSLFIPVTLE